MLKLVSALMSIILLNGCFSSNSAQIIVVDKSVNQHHVAIPRKTSINPSNKKTKTWLIPVKANISQSFSKQHSGLTFNTKIGQLVYAIRDGKVVYSGNKMKSHGQMVVIKHPFGFYSSYTQNQTLKVVVGDEVKKGQVIATTSKKPFYFEMKKFSSFINPERYLK